MTFLRVENCKLIQKKNAGHDFYVDCQERTFSSCAFRYREDTGAPYQDRGGNQRSLVIVVAITFATTTAVV